MAHGLNTASVSGQIPPMQHLPFEAMLSRNMRFFFAAAARTISRMHLASDFITLSATETSIMAFIYYSYRSIALAFSIKIISATSPVAPLKGINATFQ